MYLEQFMKTHGEKEGFSNFMEVINEIFGKNLDNIYILEDTDEIEQELNRLNDEGKIKDNEGWFTVKLSNIWYWVKELGR